MKNFFRRGLKLAAYVFRKSSVTLAVR